MGSRTQDFCDICEGIFKLDIEKCDVYQDEHSLVWGKKEIDEKNLCIHYHHRVLYQLIMKIKNIREICEKQDKGEIQPLDAINLVENETLKKVFVPRLIFG